MIKNVIFSLNKVFDCPPRFVLSSLLTVILLLGSIFLCLYSLDPPNALPRFCRLSIFRNYTKIIKNDSFLNNNNCEGGIFFSLFSVFIFAIFGGKFASLMRLPPLLGMLTMGFILRNVPYINFATYINKMWSGYLRNLALTVILIRAGLGLDPSVLRKISLVVIRLAFIPCLTEALLGGVISHFLLPLPWGWSLILGFVLSAVSPAVVVPSILELEKKGLGTDQGINTLIIAAASIDDVLSITGFGIAIAFTFSSTNSMVLNVFRGPLEALAGISYGIIIGLILWFIPSNDNDKFNFYRILGLLLLSVGAMFGSTTFHIPGAGPLAVLTLSFVTSIKWRKENNWMDIDNPVTGTTSTLWWILQPFLFGLIGAELSVHSINVRALSFGILSLFLGLLLRLIASFMAICRTSFNFKERMFISMAWLPKATVQAAIGPLALDLAIKSNSSQQIIYYGELVLSIAVISIILTAPLGALLISLTAPYLLQKSSKINTRLEITLENESVEDNKMINYKENETRL